MRSAKSALPLGGKTPIGPVEARPSRAAPEFDTFFAVSLDLLCIRDADLRFMKVNEAWESVLGYRVDELEGQPMLSFIHPDDVPASRGEMRRLEVEEEVHGFTNRYRCKDGSYRHLEWRARRVGDLVYGVARDVTQRLATEAEMQAARTAAEAANRAKSHFLANMSHEIRTPLNGVLGVVTALAKTDLTREQREMVELISSSGETLERIVSEILDISKIEAGQLEIERRPFDLRIELDRMFELFQLRASEKGLAFRVEWGSSARGEFLGDSVRLKQVAANLISNAIKFTEKGEVAIRLDVDEAATASEAALRFEVWDTGIGFAGDAVEKLFQRFSQADASITRRFGGSGLGLSISRALVEAMGGTIAARSKPGAGSVFSVSLPLPRCKTLEDYEAGRELPARGARQDGAAFAGLKVLLAEDHPINRRVVELILTPLGVELTAVEDGEQAVRAFERGRYGLVLMDMQMPVLDGLSATRAIRAREKAAGAARTPVVMLSANAMRQHSLEAEAAGADLHLPKPVTAAGLLQALEALLAR